MLHLSKWYCDCVTEAGDAFIGYWARLKLGIVTVPYVAYIFKPAREGPRQRLSFRRCAEPEIADGELRWTCPLFGVRGGWDASASSHHRTLFESPQGTISWHCHVPSAHARIRLPNVAPLCGLGYVEHLEVSLKMRHLPFDELVWGRFLSPEDTIIWIEWLGSAPRKWVFHNGVELDGTMIRRDRIANHSGDWSLELHDGAMLRDGPLVETALPSLPGARLLLPRSLLGARESKWVAQGTLEACGRASSGWAIHEVVKWR
jgi:hypothetical protein